MDTNLFNYRVFRFYPYAKELVAGRERASLDPDEQKRWDYFYRPDRTAFYDIFFSKYIAPILAEKHKKESSILELETEIAMSEIAIRGLEKSRNRAYIKTGVFAVLALALWGIGAGIHSILGFLGLGFGVLLFFRYSGLKSIFGIGRQIESYRARIGRARSEINALRQELESLKAAEDSAYATMASTWDSAPSPPPDSELQKWLKIEIAGLQKKALQCCDIEEKDITVSAGVIYVYDWGYLQGDNRPGYSLVTNGEERHEAFAITDDQDIFTCTYYVQFIFLQEHKIDVYGTFFDVISDRNYGELTDTYYYQHVSNVKVQSTQSRLPFIHDKVIEATEFSLKVTSGDSIAVTLVDETVQKSIQQFMRNSYPEFEKRMANIGKKLADAKDESESKKLRAEFEKTREEYKQIKESERATRARSAVRDIKAQLLKKQQQAVQ